MAFSVQMPALGESVTEGTVTRWLKQEGDQVEVDEPLLEVSTDKVDTEIPSPAAGVLSRIVVGEDQTVEVGAELAVINESGDGAASASDRRGGAHAAPEPAEEDQDEQPSTEPAEPAAEHADEADEPAEAPSTEQERPVARPAAAVPDGDRGGDGASGTPVTMPALGESV